MQGAAGQVGTPPVFNGQQQTLTINGLGRLNEGGQLWRDYYPPRRAGGSWCASPTRGDH
ncbi:hypothetical protein LNQ03_08600 [Klebsiella pneumoniae subsp. pneumoniae]|nr:hypothetical protein [Klebsiella pneumoniae subsp. pneumoniae]